MNLLDSGPQDPDEVVAGPSILQHWLFVGAAWLGILPVYWSDYGWPGEVRPSRVVTSGWIALDLTGLITAVYALSAVGYSVLTTAIYVHAKRRARRMSWAEYIVYAPIALLLCWLLFTLFAIL